MSDTLAESIPLTPLEPAIPALISDFINTYKEFKGLAVSDTELVVEKIKCLYPQYKEVSAGDCKLKYPFFMLVAHYLVVGGYAESIGLNKSSGLVASSSIDSVSVSYQTAPFKDNFQYFFNQTPYGQEYLAYLSTQSGLRLINNAGDRRF